MAKLLLMLGDCSIRPRFIAMLAMAAHPGIFSKLLTALYVGRYAEKIHYSDSCPFDGDRCLLCRRPCWLWIQGKRARGSSLLSDILHTVHGSFKLESVEPSATISRMVDAAGEIVI